ncbi:hypothetical protein ACH5RR_030691 [Cinchona calisaya]|uniref:Uncharacterized protein n=1 Tax=Cinchona calisaya TaxID=153742 RepID=A0ABD2YYU7_9GENT
MKAAEIEETYKIAKEGLLKMLDEVDAKLHEELVVKNIRTNVSNLDTTANASSVKFKGIKRKTKTLSGKRLKSSLEKATKRRRAKNNDSSSNVIVAPSMSSHNEPIGDTLHAVYTKCDMQYPKLQNKEII